MKRPALVGAGPFGKARIIGMDVRIPCSGVVQAAEILPTVRAVPVLIAALAACVSALEEEVAASGDERHPIIRDHAETAKRGRAAIRRAGGEQAP